MHEQNECEIKGKQINQSPKLSGELQRIHFALKQHIAIMDYRRLCGWWTVIGIWILLIMALQVTCVKGKFNLDDIYIIKNIVI